MREITEGELLERYSAGERDFRYVILQHTTLRQIQFVGVDFTGAIFNSINFKENRTKFINCNFSCVEWWFCIMPHLARCNLQYSVIEGCYFHGGFVDCDIRYSHIIGVCWDDAIMERCNLTGVRLSRGMRRPVMLEDDNGPVYGLGTFGIYFKNSLDQNGILYTGECHTFEIGWHGRGESYSGDTSDCIDEIPW